MVLGDCSTAAAALARSTRSLKLAHRCILRAQMPDNAKGFFTLALRVCESACVDGTEGLDSLSAHSGQCK